MLAHLSIYKLCAALLTQALGPRGDAFTVQAILATMKPGDFFALANQPVPESEYLLLSVLPDELSLSYDVKSGGMKIITTAAVETAMDSPYAPVGGIEFNAFQKPTAKWTATTLMTEEMQRRIQERITNIRAGVITGNTLEYIRNTVVNWLDKVIRQAVADAHELMRGEALTTGQLVLRGGTVDYEVPEANKFAKRTGGEAYAASGTTFWKDMRRAEGRLGSVRSRIMSMDTLNNLIDSQANPMAVISEQVTAGGNIKIVQVRRLIGSQQTLSQDARDGYTLVGYRRAVPIKVGKGYANRQVLPDGKIAVIGSNDITLQSPDGTIQTRPGLGRTHIGPTVEGAGRPGVWMNAYTPENRPMHAIAEGAANSLTVFDAPERLVIMDTELVG